MNNTSTIPIQTNHFIWPDPNKKEKELFIYIFKSEHVIQKRDELKEQIIQLYNTNNNIRKLDIDYILYNINANKNILIVLTKEKDINSLVGMSIYNIQTKSEFIKEVSDFALLYPSFDYDKMQMQMQLQLDNYVNHIYSIDVLFAISSKNGYGKLILNYFSDSIIILDSIEDAYIFYIKCKFIPLFFSDIKNNYYTFPFIKDNTNIYYTKNYYKTIRKLTDKKTDPNIQNTDNYYLNSILRNNYTFPNYKYTHSDIFQLVYIPHEVSGGKFKRRTLKMK